MSDNVNHPPHYRGTNGIEVINVIEGFALGHHLGAATAYILRADRKGEPIEDLEKAQFYLAREIGNRKKAVAEEYATAVAISSAIVDQERDRRIKRAMAVERRQKRKGARPRRK